MDLSNKIQRLIEPSVDDLGFDIVRVQVSGKNELLMQVMVEHKNGQGMTADDCAIVSRAISAILEVEDPIKDPYTLEVSSPGLDRPLVKLRDFERFQGHQVMVETSLAQDGQKRFKGQLLGVEDETVKILLDGREVILAYPDIRRAKLLLTDDVISAVKGSKKT
ncbi:MAG: ribosome maturation factor RimP [Rhodospirillales bacterium]